MGPEAVRAPRTRNTAHHNDRHKVGRCDIRPAPFKSTKGDVANRMAAAIAVALSNISRASVKTPRTERNKIAGLTSHGTPSQTPGTSSSGHPGGYMDNQRPPFAITCCKSKARAGSGGISARCPDANILAWKS